MENLISVIMPVYNKAPHIRRSIDSVLNQSYPNFELLIIDDGSIDGSEEIIREYKDSRIKLFYRNSPGPGGYKARNLGIEKSMGKWIAFLDADDEWKPQYLEKINKVIYDNSHVQIITTKWIKIDEQSNLTQVLSEDTLTINTLSFGLKEFLRNQDLMWTGAIAMERELIINAGLFPTCPKCKKGGDMDTWIRCLLKSEKNLLINEPLAIYYRDTVNRVTSSHNNPTTYFCSYNNLKNIFSISKDEKLRNAIKYFVNKNIYNISANHLNSTKKIDVNLLRKMFINFSSIVYSLKLVARFVLLKLHLI